MRGVVGRRAATDARGPSPFLPFADAHGFEAEMPVARDKAIDQCRGDAATCHAKGADGNGAAVHVESVYVDP